jgi:hypothetical protein
MAQQSHSSYVAQSPFRDAASRDHFRLWHFSDMANLAACPLLTEKQKFFHSICDWPLLAKRTVS